MATSQNGYSADDPSVIASYSIPRSSERIAVRKGSVSMVLLDLLGFIHDEVVNFDQHTLDEWGYAERTIRGDASTLSNHASGTAVDVDAQKHPLGSTGTWSAAAVSKIEARLSLYARAGGTQVVRWGRDYHGRKDEMHFEIVGSPSAVVHCADVIRAGRLGGGAKSYLVGRAPFSTTGAPTPAAPTLHLGDKNHEVGKLQQELRDFMARHHTTYAYPPIGPITIDNDYGPMTAKFVVHAKVMMHYKPENQQGDNATADFRHNLLTI